jgi:hypothetical protein
MRVGLILGIVGPLVACGVDRPPAAPPPPSNPVHGAWVVDAQALSGGTPAQRLAADDPAQSAPILIVGATAAQVYADDGLREGKAHVVPLDPTRWLLTTHTEEGQEHRTIVTPTGPETATFTRAPDGQPLPMRRLPGASPIP